MAITYPLSRSSFIDLLPIQSIVPGNMRKELFSGLGNGNIIAAEYAPYSRLLQFNLRPVIYDDEPEIKGLIESLEGSIGTFYTYFPPKLYPKYDPTGSILGSNTVTIDDIGGDNKSLLLTGLPVGYQLNIGDFLSFDFGTPAKRAFHRILETATADGSGTTGQFEITPNVYSGTIADIEVTLKIPEMKCRMMPNSYNEGQIQGQHVEGISFQAVQVL